MQTPLLVKDLVSLEAYASEHEEFRAEVTAHRIDRTVRVGRSATLQFEDELSVRYRIQETLRAESIVDEEAIQAEIDACAPLIPDGSNLKATFTIELPEGDERRARVAKLVGIEARVWLQVDGAARIFAVAEEVMPRDEDEDAPPAEHFLRFDLEKPLVRDLKGGSPLSIGIDHPAYSASLVLGDAVRQALLKDLR
jgi:hypothetical protein